MRGWRESDGVVSCRGSGRAAADAKGDYCTAIWLAWPAASPFRRIPPSRSWTWDSETCQMAMGNLISAVVTHIAPVLYAPRFALPRSARRPC